MTFDENTKIIISGALFLVWFILSAIKLFGGNRNKAKKGQEFLILYASQNGQAEEIATHSHKVLLAGNKTAGIIALSDATPDILSNAQKILVIASTTGVGDAPTNGIKFEKNIMSQKLDLSSKEYAILALGDKNYIDYCAFGKRIDEWFVKTGAYKLNETILVDDLDKASLQAWDNALKELGGTEVAEDDGFRQVAIKSIRHINPKSDAAGLYEIHFATNDELGINQWQAGDLCEILTPDGHRRDYSIASLPEEGSVCLYVRQLIKDDGRIGIGSGYLTNSKDDDIVSLRVKSHKNFHSPSPKGATLMIAAGSGYAGLRPHIKILSSQAEKIWLLYGERTRDKDNYLITEAQDWVANGHLVKADFSYSREADAHKYVQNLIAANEQEIKEFLESGNGAGGNIIICGGLNMGLDVNNALKNIMGADWVENATNDGRYLKDLY